MRAIMRIKKYYAYDGGALNCVYCYNIYARIVCVRVMFLAACFTHLFDCVLRDWLGQRQLVHPI